MLLLFLLFFPSLQIRFVITDLESMLRLSRRSYFHSATKKVLDHLRAWRRAQQMQFTGTLIVV